MKTVYGLSDIDQVVNWLIKNIKTKTLLLHGSMGVGKTTLIKAIVKKIGSNDEVSSPTFSIVNEYDFKDGKIYHFDFYRISDLNEAYDFGIEEYLNSNNWKLIEWPDLIEPILDNNFDKITIEFGKKNKRVLILNS